ncbi:MAG: SRPBCC family protein [Flavobacteriaceae bacterium]|nr:SRPBCC family protein [Flavobacteriaceae bacterium]
MTNIELTTHINAPIALVFDLNRSIDFHQQTFKESKEKAVAGVISGLIELHGTVTWRGKHFGFYVEHESVITEMNKPYSFTDEMKKGQFKWLKHQHIFKEENGIVMMTDYFSYDVPFSFIGSVLNKMILEPYLKHILIKRNKHVKQKAESLSLN